MTSLEGNGTDRLIISILESRDVEAARALHNDDSTLKFLTDITHVSEVQQEAWYQSISTSKTLRRYVARRRSDDAFVGVFRIDRLDPWNRSAWVGADVVRSLRGQGYAGDMYLYVLSLLFDQYGLNRVALETLAENKAALGLYQKLGFQQEGLARQAIFRDGAMHDLVIMGLLADEWRAARPA
jgi:RimJ/RimL family protein N-acetyltransferase